MAETAYVQYLFLDVVRYSYRRSVEAQSQVISALNSIVKDSLAQHGVDASTLVLLPTGDGICIALLNLINPYDLPIQIGITILERLKKYNDSTADVSRRFELRIGLNENVDNVVVDINGRQNVAGTGINTAQRIMGLADGMMIFLGESIHDKLSQREAYAQKFIPRTATVKHGLLLRAFQFHDEKIESLSREIPTQFAAAERTDPQLNEYVAAYAACIFRYADFISRTIAEDELAGSFLITLFHFLATTIMHEPPVGSLSRGMSFLEDERKGVEENYLLFRKMHFRPVLELASFVRRETSESAQFRKMFSEKGLRLTAEGSTRLQSERPDMLRALERWEQRVTR